ncbi:hypothetical protein SPI_04626 [Niveomyces insectorum RCEF 264]|uniref:Rhodopsin domain-containing protein n=1 Tax=Niveomyces insectorum RCEF 264 TaxID=1081102 RepID=A0A167UPB5_9HYPO|nr:hypothetical protein SPI_04626 [Niveomyces insectorum RCEF 264]
MAPLPHDNEGPALNALSVLLVVFSAAFLLLRVILKIRRRRGLWWDDYLLVTAWVILTAGVALNVIDVGVGYGRHTWDVSPAHIAEIITNGTISGTLILLAACYSKTSFACTLLRLPIGWMRYLVWGIIVTLNVTMHLSALSIWIECPPGPPPTAAKGAAAPRLCLPIPVAVWFGIAVSIYSAVVDFTLALLPWKFLWNLQMQRREKIGVLIAMSMGVFAGLAAVIKATKLMTLESPDIIDGVQLAAWATAEVGVTIMAASIPILRALFHRPSSMPMNYAENGSGATPARRRGAAAAAAAAAATAATVNTTPDASNDTDTERNAVVPAASVSEEETKEWPLVAPRGAAAPKEGLDNARPTGYDEDDYDDEDDLQKPPRDFSGFDFRS